MFRQMFIQIEMPYKCSFKHICPLKCSSDECSFKHRRIDVHRNTNTYTHVYSNIDAHIDVQIDTHLDRHPHICWNKPSFKQMLSKTQKPRQTFKSSNIPT